MEYDKTIILILFIDLIYIYRINLNDVRRAGAHDDGVFNECMISDQESDNENASINSKDNGDDTDDDDADDDDDD